LKLGVFLERQLARVEVEKALNVDVIGIGLTRR
jgi:hypothetical protein